MSEVLKMGNGPSEVIGSAYSKTQERGHKGWSQEGSGFRVKWVLWSLYHTTMCPRCQTWPAGVYVCPSGVWSCCITCLFFYVLILLTPQNESMCHISLLCARSMHFIFAFIKAHSQEICPSLRRFLNLEFWETQELLTLGGFLDRD